MSNQGIIFDLDGTLLNTLHALEDLARKGVPMGVLSNKPQEATLDTVGHFFPDGYLQVVQGALPGRTVLFVSPGKGLRTSGQFYFH